MKVMEGGIIKFPTAKLALSIAITTRRSRPEPDDLALKQIEELVEAVKILEREEEKYVGKNS